MKLVYERSRPGRRAGRVPETGVEAADVPAELRRAKPPRLPEIAEPELEHRVRARVRLEHAGGDRRTVTVIIMS